MTAAERVLRAFVDALAEGGDADTPTPSEDVRAAAARVLLEADAAETLERTRARNEEAA